MSDDHPEMPFESLSADIFSVAGKQFLVYVDRLSGWPVVYPLGTDITSAAIIRRFRWLFRDLGVPVRLRSDGGPQFTSQEFAEFLKRWGVRHIVTSPHYPQSNGHAEAAVKKTKYLIMKTTPTGNIDTEGFDRGLLELRNTPFAVGRSPAQILFGRPLRSCVPAHRRSFAMEWQTKAESCDRRAASRAEDVEDRYNLRARPLPVLGVGVHVRIQSPTSKRWDTSGVVMGVGRSRDYHVRMPSGRILWRNRRFLRPIPCPPDEQPDTDVSGSPSPPVTPCPTTPRPRRSRRLAEKKSVQGPR